MAEMRTTESCRSLDVRWTCADNKFWISLWKPTLTMVYHRIVIPVVVGSSPIVHPNFPLVDQTLGNILLPLLGPIRTVR